LPGVERIWLPGEQSHTKKAERLVLGIPIPLMLRKNLDELARELGIDPIM
jgi:L-2-hydroxycarboxylate dehydrogenase (NAD+)